MTTQNFLSNLERSAASFAGPRLHKRVGVWRAAGTCAPHPGLVGYDGSGSGDIAHCGIPAQASGGARVRAAGPDGARERLDSSDQTDRHPRQIGSPMRRVGSGEQNDREGHGDTPESWDVSLCPSLKISPVSRMLDQAMGWRSGPQGAGDGNPLWRTRSTMTAAGAKKKVAER